MRVPFFQAFQIRNRETLFLPLGEPTDARHNRGGIFAELPMLSALLWRWLRKRWRDECTTKSSMDLRRWGGVYLLTRLQLRLRTLGLFQLSIEGMPQAKSVKAALKRPWQRNLSISTIGKEGSCNWRCRRRYCNSNIYRERREPAEEGRMQQGRKGRRETSSTVGRDLMQLLLPAMEHSPLIIYTQE